MDVDGPILTALIYERGEVTKDGQSVGVFAARAVANAPP